MKWAALFQIFLILGSVFSVSLLAPTPVIAEEQQVCCSETVDNNHCQYVPQSQCKPGSLQASTSCSQTSFCKLGCGFDQESGRCFKNTPKFTCQSNGQCTWTESASCDIPQCQQGCCVLSNECSFVTQLQCKRITSQFKDVNMTFDESITDEFACINQCRSFERGACVTSEGSCTFTTRAECGVQATLEVNQTGPLVGFHPNRLCSNPQLGTECAAQQYTDCLPNADGVYWFDSCGNPENIYSADKRASYNNGFILPKEQSCNNQNNNINNPGCGNCDFTKGTLCGVAPSTVNPTFGDYACLDLSCNTIRQSPTSPASQSGQKKLGESWCSYDGAPGFGRDFVGSRHYRQLCINGQELTEPCKDFREEICVQGVQGQPPLGTQQSFALGQGEYIEALCRPNRHSSCPDIKNQYDCENIQARDCYWIGKRLETSAGEQKQRENTEGKCAPLVSPGIAFWPGESTTKVSGLDPKATCDKGNTECKVVWQKAGLGGDLLKGSTWSGDGAGWKCVGNCECLNKEYLQATNNYCKSLGDCGAWYNINGKFTTGGFIETNNNSDLTSADVEDYDSLVFPAGGKSDYNNKFGAFFKQAAPGLIVIGLTAVGTAIAFYGYGTMALGQALGQGFFAGTSGVFGLEAMGDTTLGQLAGRSFTTGTISPAAGAQAYPAVAGDGVSFAGGQIYTKVPKAMADQLAQQLPKTYVDATGRTISTVTPAGQGLSTVNIPAGQTPFATVPKGGFQATQGTTVQPAASGGGQFFYALNIIAWVYTIYSLLDVLLADTKTETITISCQPWVAPSGGADCEKCTAEGKECSEYRCRSLGQTCKLLNAGTKQEACVNAHPNDATSPIIHADSSALARGYTLTEATGVGFTLNQKIEPFTAVSLGIKTDEFSQCKFSTELSKTYDQMTNFFGEGIFAQEHKTTFALSSLMAKDEALRLTNGGKYTVYLRCQDGNGNKNNKAYYINFAIKPGPDITAPVIEATSIANGAYVPTGVNATVLTLYTNEPSTCKWDDIDTEFEQMHNSFACTTSQQPTSSIYYGLYDCTTLLDNIQAGRANNYYMRCKDQVGNVNSDSYPFRLTGTIPLEITSVAPPQGTRFFIANPLVKVVTSKGAQGGVAVCGYNFNDPTPVNALEFSKTNSTTHEQQFEALVPGDYTTYISCFDVAGNLAQTNTTFNVNIDTLGPHLSQIYTEGTLLYIITHEDSICEYSSTGAFAFGRGVRMTGENTREHTTTLDNNVYYLTCRDAFQNDASYRVFV
ncbi:MAG: hypothetical protein Q8L34_01735 [Candidatus Woesearchaeota archaeon]|nr:hypothetical protein [Candidatus Woesearchaeota archaeon]